MQGRLTLSVYLVPVFASTLSIIISDVFCNPTLRVMVKVNDNKYMIMILILEAKPAFSKRPCKNVMISRLTGV